MTQTILRVDASARRTGSVTRDLTDLVVAKFQDARVVTRDLADPLPHVTEDWINANFTPADQRSEVQRETLAQSDALVAEVKAADVVVIGLPIYNFSAPAALKAWNDLVARVGMTFQYTENGPVGLLEGKRAILVVASGGTKAGSDIDYATTYMKHFLGFIGIKDVEMVAADQLAIEPEATVAAAKDAVAQLAA